MGTFKVSAELLTLAGLILFSGCVRNANILPTESAAGSSVPSWSATIYPMFSGSTCFSCHANGASSGGMGLGTNPTAATLYADWVNVTASTENNCGISDYISAPGNSANSGNSLVLQKLNGSCAPQMPETGSVFTATQISELTAWINAGAPNN